jgi:adenosylmethionine-8-amino-7-oxononanoate aminotransferase
LHRTMIENPDLAVRGERITLELASGARVLDASGGAAVACIGYGNARVAARIGDQTRQLMYAHSGFLSCEPAEELADLLLREEPGSLACAYFVSSGSEAMESAIKLARQYFLEIGEPRRMRFIGRRQGFHGNTVATLAAGGHASRRAPYEPILPSVFSHVSPCFTYHFRHSGESDVAYVSRLENELDEEFHRVGPDSVAAFFAETVVGATTGCVTPVPGYFEAVRRVCDRHGALLVLDEVMCGSGRTGTMHAWEQEGVVPDIQALGKGLGGGYQPIGAVLITKKIVEALTMGSGAFVHGHTYQAHPVACAAALEVQRIIEEQGLLENVRKGGAFLERRLREQFGEHEHVADIRGRGLFFALEFMRDRQRKIPFDPARRLNQCVKKEGIRAGVAIYPSGGTIDGVRGDHILIAPPYITTCEEIDEMVARLARAIDEAIARLN